MSDPKRASAPPIPSAVWLTVPFAGRADTTSRRLLADRLSGYLAGSGIRPTVSTRLIGLHHARGLAPVDIASVAAWLKAQPEVKSLDFMPPVPSILSKGSHHG